MADSRAELVADGLMTVPEAQEFSAFLAPIFMG